MTTVTISSCKVFSGNPGLLGAEGGASDEGKDLQGRVLPETVPVKRRGTSEVESVHPNVRSQVHSNILFGDGLPRGILF